MQPHKMNENEASWFKPGIPKVFVTIHEGHRNANVAMEKFRNHPIILTDAAPYKATTSGLNQAGSNQIL